MRKSNNRIRKQTDFKNSISIALKYVIKKQIFGFVKTNTEKYVARQISSGQVDFSKLCTQVGQICGTHRGTV
ncbi:MAG: hypothetical protein LIO65_09715 [Odoribacter sp.]|nr:hypothetical protein [Odoribacter sp.]